ncbi:hypothetical protein KEM48_001387 [Puccinia striiformis f. sp. tritici PST-130]|nr:hypothetical protein KEM48_001387 [Puccinia striiformis f. sp. tritici PST-130]
MAHAYPVIRACDSIESEEGTIGVRKIRRDSHQFHDRYYLLHTRIAPRVNPIFAIPFNQRVKDAGLRRTGQSQLMRSYSVHFPFDNSQQKGADVKKIDAEEVDAEEVAALKGHAWGNPACMKEELKKFSKSGKVFEGIGSVSEVGKLSSTHRINQIVALEEQCFTKRGKGKRKGQHFRDQLLLIYLMTEKPLLHESQENLAEVVDVALQCLASLCKRFNDENYTGLHLATSTVWDRIYDEHKIYW